jgi:hypothetical protein
MKEKATPGPGPKEYDANIGDWGHLPNEPCRFCRQVGGVYFLIDDGPEGKAGLEIVRCDKCKRSWTVDSANA